MADRKYLEALSKRLADDGKLVEAGWIGLRLLAVPQDVPATQLNDMRMAFMAGANHLFSSIMTMLDPGTEETAADLRRMDLIAKELEIFEKELALRAVRPSGSA